VHRTARRGPAREIGQIDVGFEARGGPVRGEQREQIPAAAAEVQVRTGPEVAADEP
jgi:hypothetical protein